MPPGTRALVRVSKTYTRYGSVPGTPDTRALVQVKAKYYHRGSQPSVRMWVLNCVRVVVGHTVGMPTYCMRMARQCTSCTMEPNTTPLSSATQTSMHYGNGFQAVKPTVWGGIQVLRYCLFTRYIIILRTSSASSKKLGSILVFASCVLLVLVAYYVVEFFHFILWEGSCDFVCFSSFCTLWGGYSGGGYFLGGETAWRKRGEKK